MFIIKMNRIDVTCASSGNRELTLLSGLDVLAQVVP